MRRALPDLGWEGWWYKAYIFAPELQLNGTILYLDLDTIICGSLDWLTTVIDSYYTTMLPTGNPTTTIPTNSQLKSILPVFITLSAGQFASEGNRSKQYLISSIHANIMLQCRILY